MGFGSSFARDWTISKTSRFFGKNRIADPLLARLADDPSPEIRDAVTRHTYSLGQEHGAGFRERVQAEDVLTIVESFLITIGVPYDRKGTTQITIRTDFTIPADHPLCTPVIAGAYLRGLLAGLLPDWISEETDGEIRYSGRNK
ncbi:MAG: Uncharacterized protein XE11_1140 [Methanomicrobiales archaeon 53_19]|uniref:hypothetical protein n=1 Tax=Methanocalculus sp. TaxID=2004547 RepID=UPI0007486879|nr:hypothetical protein [Methanocalculus sp.]KUL03622.1 MAG: Uncharacterized protein XE11_1140 [Methanomicrobiales archaeon 53_19]HIJ06254.1 hypothetical protein [Methanocalculus sp.]